MNTLTVDLGIVGSGSGNSLITPFWDEKRVVLADRGTGPDRVFGGTCLNVGCIPTKMYVRPATLARSPEEAARLNVAQQTLGVDWPAMRDRVFSRIDAISEAGRAYRDVELENVELLAETVTLAPDLLDRREHTGRFCFTAESGTQVEAEQLVIAAGSRAVLPEVSGIDLPQVHTSDSVMRLEELPSRVLIIGGGYIACEFAGIFSGLGAEVIQANRSVGLMSALDEEISRAYSARAEQSWTVLYERTLGRVVPAEGEPVEAGAVPGGSGRVTAQLVTSDGREEDYEVDVVLVAIGRRPNSDLVGAQQAGLDLHEDGRIAVDDHQRVLADGAPVEGLYALGDVSSQDQLKHVANHEARVVSHNLERPGDLRRSRRHAVPSAVFSHPELAQVGLTEVQAAEQVGEENLTVKVQNYGDTAYGWAMEEQHGIFKVIADRRDGRILGAHAMGPQSSNLIQPVVQAMSFGQDAHTVARGQYWIHPALMEVTENALLGLEVPIPEGAPL